MKKIYVAGPLGFSEAGRKFYYEVLLPAIRDAGFEPLDPWSNDAKAAESKEWSTAASDIAYDERMRAWQRYNASIAAWNMEAIDVSDGLVAVLDGMDVDSGTAAEIGYAFARGLPILGYRGDVRVGAENPAAIVNLQVEYFIVQSGGMIMRSIEELTDALPRMMRNSR